MESGAAELGEGQAFVVPTDSTDHRRLRVVKLVHTGAWVFFVACIIGIYIAAWQGALMWASVCIAIVAAEVGVLALNGWRCPLTAVAARYTSDRSPNFDIFLPRWVARYNKEIFGPLYLVGILATAYRWLTAPSLPYQALADTVLLLHFTVVLFVVLGLPVILVGNRFGWSWVNLRWWRLAHLAAIAVVVVQAWLGRWCGLTELESWLREQAGQAGYERGFIEHWVQRVIYYQAPVWVFALLYTGFAALVAWAWWRFPPKPAEDADPATTP